MRRNRLAGRVRRLSPRKKGHPALPYFAVGAVLAIGLCVTLAVASSALLHPTVPKSRPNQITSQSADRPALFLSHLELVDEAQLETLMAKAPAAKINRDATVAELASAASGLPEFRTLPQCLQTLPESAIPTRVDAGTWQGVPAWFIVAASASAPAKSPTISGESDTVFVLAPGECTLIAKYP